MPGGKEGSVAPEERVNIVFKPATEGAQEEKELPLKMEFIGDFTMRTDDTPLEDRKKICIDKNNFDEVMRSQQLELSMTVPNRLSGREGEDMPVTIRINGIKDFNPDSIVQQVPELNKLLVLRAGLQSLKGPLGNVPAFKKMIDSLIGDAATRQQLLQELGVG
ncbi:MAG: type VI secretion system contractile sheath small subunit [Nitrospira sp.]|nr:type VI secretion system contractile sheath small subunit [Nitrospira sp.]